MNNRRGRSTEQRMRERLINAMTFSDSGGCRYRDRSGKRIRESTEPRIGTRRSGSFYETGRLQARDDRILDIVRKGEHFRFAEWVDWFLAELLAASDSRAPDPRSPNLRCSAHLKKAFENRNLGDLTADDVELYLRRRLQDRVYVTNYRRSRLQRGRLKPATVHQELRVFAGC